MHNFCLKSTESWTVMKLLFTFYQGFYAWMVSDADFIRNYSTRVLHKTEKVYYSWAILFSLVCIMSFQGNVTLMEIVWGRLLPYSQLMLFNFQPYICFYRRKSHLSALLRCKCPYTAINTSCKVLSIELLSSEDIQKSISYTENFILQQKFVFKIDVFFEFYFADWQ